MAKEKKNTKTIKKLAEELGVSEKTIKNKRKTLGLSGATTTNEGMEKVAEIVNVNVELKKANVEKVAKLTEVNKTFVPNVRRINEKNTSSINELLQDAKDRYVRNEELIQRLQHEIDSQETLMNGNINGTVSSIPQLSTMERYMKINISLRNQIVELENILGKVNGNEESDPFN